MRPQVPPPSRSPTPFPIYDYTSGLRLDREPWITPDNAFRELENFYAYRGRLVKRAGSEWLGTLGYAASETLAGTVGLTSISGTLSNVPPLPARGSYEIYFTDGGGPAQEVVDDPSVATGTESSGIYALVDKTSRAQVGTINYWTGAFSFTLGAPAANNVAVTYEYAQENEVMGIQRFTDRTGTEFLIVCDTKRVWKWDSSDLRFVSICNHTDKFTGDETNHFWFAAVDNELWITNDVDGVVKFDPSLAGPDYIAAVTTTYTGGSVGAARIAIFVNGIMVYINIVDNGGRERARARWAPINDPENLQPEDFSDCDIDEQAVSAIKYGDDILVFFESQPKLLKFQPDSSALWAWRDYRGQYGSSAKMSTVAFNDVVFTRGRTAIVVADELNAEPLDQDIPDLNLDWDANLSNLSFGILADEVRQVLMSYAKLGDAAPENAVGFNTRNGSFTTYDLDFHTYGKWLAFNEPDWDDFTDPWDLPVLEPFDDLSVRGGLPVLLGGDRQGRIYQVFRTSKDFSRGTGINLQGQGQNIVARARSIRLNPWPLGKVRLHYLGLLVDRIDGATLTVRLFKDFSTQPYRIINDIDISGTNTDDEKVLVELKRLGQVAHWHTVEVESSDGSLPGIDLMVPWFSYTGMLRSIGQ